MKNQTTISDLIARFERNLEEYKAGRYNEAQVRREFIDPFFKALGWDIDNAKGYAEAYKEVVHEDAIKVGHATKAPDYSFRIGGVRKFFLEAKKPSVFIKEEIHPAYQLRRYAWSAKLPVSILTDFEEFAVYDCRIKPVQTDKAAAARILYLTFRDYAERWDELASIFSPDAIMKGSFDKFVEAKKGKRGAAEVDEAFLEEIEYWRESLARNLALRNPHLSQRDLNFAVQRTIDRIVFLRICEDRGIEQYETLRALQNGARVYPRLVEMFYRADERFNSGLFHFQPEKDRPGDSIDNLTPDLTIDDEVLKVIIKSLYYPDSPYEFSVLPADILGQVYERFLGKVIRLTAGHRAVVEDKPEVRKAGGVYYTPTYIVDYIVRQTVGKLVEGKKPGPRGGVSQLRILDPACGSGSFLLGAYQFLLDWHLDAYLSDGAEKWAAGRSPRIYKNDHGEWRVTSDERKRILLRNIYGVDIDPQAVEVTKLSLLLKVLEGEDEQSISRQLAFFHERVLPELGGNIKCGNSLIGPDFYDGQQLNLLSEDEMYRINAFDWQREFAEIMAAGGFDAVIGNPPWGADFREDELEYLRKRNRPIIVRMIDSFMYFVFQMSEKLKAAGYFGMILPDVILYQIDNEKLRRHLLMNYKINSVFNMGNVFEKVTRPTSILVFENVSFNENSIRISDFSQFEKIEKRTALFDEKYYEQIKQKELLEIPGALFVTSQIDRYLIWNRVNKVPHQRLENLVDDDGIQRGVSPDLQKAFIVESETVRKYDLEKSKLREVLTGGKQVKRYFIEYPDLWLIYTRRDDNFRELPNICGYIDQFKNEITCSEVRQKKHPLYSLHRPREERIFTKNKKLVGVITGDKITVAMDEMQTFATDGLYLFGLKSSVNPYYLMGILNSSLFVFVYRLLAIEKGRVLAQVKPTILEQLPIRRIDFSNPKDKARHDQIVALVERMLKLHQQKAAAQTGETLTLQERQIAATDHQIDRLVYELYELKEEEIKIVEESTK